MSRVFAFILAGMLHLVSAQNLSKDSLVEEDGSDGLPEWDDQELEALESGEYIPGSSLMGKLAREILDSESQEVIVLDPEIQQLPDEGPKSLEWSKAIGEEYLPAYFRGKEVGYLVDPQELLATQEFRDRETFLNRHARDFIIDCHFYLFDGLQEIPEEESLEALVESHYDGDNPLAVVFYFMGNPGRSQLVFSNRVVDVIRLEEREMVLRLAIEDALEKSDSASQLESFSIQLSVGLERLEEIVSKEGGSLLGGQIFVMDEKNRSLPNQPSLGDKLLSNQWFSNTLIGLSVLIPACLIGLKVYRITRKRKTYVFPIAEGSGLLDAPHGAGVGGVLSFVSATAPPSSQKQDVPDYLQKI
jgi:hypothetical protein